MRDRVGISNRDVLQPTPTRQGRVGQEGKAAREALVEAEVIRFRQLELRGGALIDEGGDVRERRRRLRESNVAFERVRDARAIGDADAAVVEEAEVLAFAQVFEDDASVPADAPVVAVEFGVAVAGARQEAERRQAAAEAEQAVINVLR